MKKTFLTLLVSFPLMASENISSTIYTRNQQGNWSLSGSGGAGYATGGIGFATHADLTALYYLKNKYSLGLTTSANYASGGNSYSQYLGLAMQYDFLQLDRVLFYVRGSAMTSVKELFRDNMITGELGMDFFITPGFSIGPYLRMTHATNQYDSASYLSSSGRMTLHF